MERKVMQHPQQSTPAKAKPGGNMFAVFAKLFYSKVFVLGHSHAAIGARQATTFHLLRHLGFAAGWP